MLTQSLLDFVRTSPLLDVDYSGSSGRQNHDVGLDNNQGDPPQSDRKATCNRWCSI